jgi:hypothetical protein
LTYYGFEFPNPIAFRQFSGHSINSRIPEEVYTHPKGKESSKVILAKRGLIDENTEGLHAQHRSLLSPKYCPFCNRDNKPDARFCSNEQCGAPLIRAAHAETKKEAEKTKKEAEKTKKEAEKTKKELQELRDNQEALQKTMSSMLKVILGESDKIQVYNTADDDEETISHQISFSSKVLERAHNLRKHREQEQEKNTKESNNNSYS